MPLEGNKPSLILILDCLTKTNQALLEQAQYPVSAPGGPPLYTGVNPVCLHYSPVHFSFLPINRKGNEMTFPHFFNLGNGKTILFNPEICENCGQIVRAANSVGGVATDIPTYKKLGIQEMYYRPVDSYYSDDLDKCACYGCGV